MFSAIFHMVKVWSTYFLHFYGQIIATSVVLFTPNGGLVVIGSSPQIPFLQARNSSNLPRLLILYTPEN